MSDTVSKTLAPMRRVSATVWGESVTIDCPDWCVTDHASGVFFKEDLIHAGRKVSVTLPVQPDGQRPTLHATLMSWTHDAASVAETIPPCVTISRGIVSELTGTIDVLHSAELSALADTHDSAELRSLASQLAAEETRYETARRKTLAPPARWADFQREVCAGCGFGTAERSARPVRKFIVPAAPAPVSGCTPCACGGCMDVTMSGDMANPELCSECSEAGCEPNGECQRPETYQP
jgi:hypothetical protein